DVTAQAHLVKVINDLNTALLESPLKAMNDELKRTADVLAAADAYSRLAITVAKFNADTQRALATEQDKIAVLRLEGLAQERFASQLAFRQQREQLVLEIVAASTLEEQRALVARLASLDGLEAQ